MTEHTHTFYHLMQLVADWLRCHLSERHNVIYMAKRCIHLKQMFKGAFLGQNVSYIPRFTKLVRKYVQYIFLTEKQHYILVLT